MVTTIKNISKKAQRKSSSESGIALLDADVLNKYLPALPLIDGENLSDYEAFQDACLSAIKPKDAIEQIWLRDFIDYSWESLRLRRMELALIHVSRKDAVQRLVRECLGDDISAYQVSKDLAQGWSASDEEDVSTVEALLSKHGFDLDSIFAEAISLKLKDIERIDKLIASYDYRRDAAIRELEKRRDLLAKRAREFADSVITDVAVTEI